MNAHAYCRYTLNCTKEDYEAMKAVISAANRGDLEEPEEKVIEVTGSYYVSEIEAVDDLAMELARSARDASFVMEGSLDTREDAGDYMNYRYEYKNRKLMCQLSDQYFVVKTNIFEDYDEYIEQFENSCEEYDSEDNPVKPLTQAQFEKCACEEDGEFYVLKEGFGDHVLVVPLDEPGEIQLEYNE